MSCEDFPCCGHEFGCCPSYDENGKQLDMVCTCGARLPVESRYSICDSCMDSEDDELIFDGYHKYEMNDEFDEDEYEYDE